MWLDSVQSAVGDTTIQIDEGLREHNRLSSAHQNMDALIDSGRNILGNLKDQKGILKVCSGCRTDVRGQEGSVRYGDKEYAMFHFLAFLSKG